MKRMIVGLLSVCLLGSLTVLAEEKATTEKAIKPEVALQDITATGKLAKLATSFTVTEADGTVVKIFAPKAVKGEAAPAVTTEALEKLVGKDVKVVGKGAVTTKKDGSKKVGIKILTSIEEAAAPAAPAAAAPAAAPAAPAAPAAAPAAAPEAK